MANYGVYYRGDGVVLNPDNNRVFYYADDLISDLVIDVDMSDISTLVYETIYQAAPEPPYAQNWFNKVGYNPTLQYNNNIGLYNAGLARYTTTSSWLLGSKQWVQDEYGDAWGFFNTNTSTNYMNFPDEVTTDIWSGSTYSFKITSYMKEINHTPYIYLRQVSTGFYMYDGSGYGNKLTISQGASSVAFGSGLTVGYNEMLFVKDNNNWTLYKNGEYSGSVVFNATLDNDIMTILGSVSSGVTSQIKFWNRALIPSEVKLEYDTTRVYKQIFTSGTTWEAPSNIRTLEMECRGAGGTGAGYTIYGPGGGGGGGAFSKTTTHIPTGNATYTISCGTGVDSSVVYGSTLCLAVKGENGHETIIFGDDGNGGAGGSASSCIGDIKQSGGNGARQTNVGALGGGGGAGAQTGKTGSHASASVTDSSNTGGTTALVGYVGATNAQFLAEDRAGNGGNASTTGFYPSGGGGGRSGVGGGGAATIAGASGIVIFRWTLTH